MANMSTVSHGGLREHTFHYLLLMSQGYGESPPLKLENGSLLQ